MWPVPRNNPVDLYRVREGVYAADLLITAVTRLDFFSWLAETPADLDRICAAPRSGYRPDPRT